MVSPSCKLFIFIFIFKSQADYNSNKIRSVIKEDDVCGGCCLGITLWHTAIDWGYRETGRPVERGATLHYSGNKGNERGSEMQVDRGRHDPCQLLFPLTYFGGHFAYWSVSLSSSSLY